MCKFVNWEDFIFRFLDLIHVSMHYLSFAFRISSEITFYIKYFVLSYFADVVSNVSYIYCSMHMQAIPINVDFGDKIFNLQGSERIIL